MARKKPSRLTKELLETAGDMHRLGFLERTAYEKITMRHLGKKEAPAVAPITGAQIRGMRERARMSQAVLSQLERGAKHPTGAALALLNVIRRTGIEAIL